MASLGEPEWSPKAVVLGEIESLAGYVSVQNGPEGAEVEGFPGMALHPGDILSTDSTSRAFILWGDGSRFYLNKETRLELQPVSHRISLPQGEIFSMMKPQEKPFEIKTPGTLVTIIGTDFSLSVTESHKTLLKVYRGKVAYENEKGKVVAHQKEQVESSPYLIPKAQPLKEKKNLRAWVNTMTPDEVQKGEEKMKKYLLTIIVVLLVIVGALAYQNFSGSGVAPTIAASTLSSFPTNVDEKAVMVIESLNKGEYAKVVGLFDTKMKAAMDEKKLAAVWNSSITQMGAYQNHLGVSTTIAHLYSSNSSTSRTGDKVTTEYSETTTDVMCAYVTCSFAKGTTDYQIVFNDKGEISGLWIVPAFSNKGAALTDAEVVPLAVSFADKLINKDYEGAESAFDGTMKSALPVTALKSTWEGLPAQVGNYKSRGGTRSAAIANSRVVYVSLEFEKASLDMKVVFNTQKEISGLWFVPAGSK
jgi:hypothetical protein